MHNQVELQTVTSEDDINGPAVMASLEKVSLWASHSRLCIAMIFALAMQDLAHEFAREDEAASEIRVR